ncbi:MULTISPECIES: hypothetical protein [unclassified Streptomyces]|uniref:hypothetical protein n=1 Tax=unclassified Streptomyces TaxID=2593676 RepID=UPI00364B187E
MNTHGDDTDLLDDYLRAALARLGPANFEAVIRAADATCQLLANGQPAVLAGPDGAAFGPDLQREYLALLAVLITGRTDHPIVPLPSPDGTPGWAVIEHHLTQDPRALGDLCARIGDKARGSARTGTALEQLWRAS